MAACISGSILASWPGSRRCAPPARATAASFCGWRRAASGRPSSPSALDFAGPRISQPTQLIQTDAVSICLEYSDSWPFEGNQPQNMLMRRTRVRALLHNFSNCRARRYDKPHGCSLRGSEKRHAVLVARVRVRRQPAVIHSCYRSQRCHKSNRHGKSGKNDLLLRFD